MTSPLIQNINLFLDDKPSVFALRERAKSSLLKQGFPTAKTEAWKYTNVKELIQKNFLVNNTEHSCEHDCCHHHHSNSFIEIRFCNGKLHVEEYDTPKGIIVTPLPLALYEGDYKKYIFNSYDLEKHPFASLNGIYLEQGICIEVEKNVQIDTPVLIKYKFDNCENQQLNIHNIIVLNKNAKLDLIEDFTSSQQSSHLTNIVNEVYLKEQAVLTHYKKQQENALAYHIALNALKIYEKAKYKQIYYANGAKLSRQETLINLEQPFSSAEIYSAYRAKKESLTDITTNINHLADNTDSNQYAKAVLEENSTATFQGKIHIAPYAVKTSGYQLHKALYLDDTASLNCKPELEIYADDVKCSHGASCGELDKEQLFYLTSRGINKTTAIDILTKAHLEEIFAYIDDEKIKDLFFLTE